MKKKASIKQLFSLKSKSVFVTGATGQLGRQICRDLAQAGATVYATDKIIHKRMTVKRSRVHYSVLDVTQKDKVGKYFKKLSSRGKKIDILINNAGVSVFEPYLDRTEEDFDFVTDVNLKGAFFCIQSFVKLFRHHKQAAGSIINIGSIYGVVSPDFSIYTDCKRVNSEVYGATKAGVIQMTKYFSVQLAPLNIRVNCISPGGIVNEQNPQGADFMKRYAARCPLGRMAYTEDIAGGILFLASDASQYITGQNIIIDGGLTSW